MIYDVIFMIQHFCLYKENNERLHRQQQEAACVEEDSIGVRLTLSQISFIKKSFDVATRSMNKITRKRLL